MQFWFKRAVNVLLDIIKNLRNIVELQYLAEILFAVHTVVKA